jgi:thymidine kinase
MAKLYFNYGAMGCSKSAQALMCKFNYEQKGFNVLLLKPSIDTRDYDDGKPVVKSRIGIKSECKVFDKSENLLDLYKAESKIKRYDVLIIDEAQFCSENQINECKEISEEIPVLCYGLKTNFKSYLFEGSKRLIEIADNINEIKSVCSCGSNATVNARLVNGELVTSGDEIVIGGDETYVAMCYTCWRKLAKEQEQLKDQLKLDIYEEKSLCDNS